MPSQIKTQSDLSIFTKTALISVIIGIVVSALGLTDLLHDRIPKFIIDLHQPLLDQFPADYRTPDHPLSWSVLGLLAAMAVAPLVRIAIPHIWPGLPDILISFRWEDDAFAEDPRGAGRPLVAREEELQSLARFAGSQATAKARWTAITGPMGIGKTKLAMEWLAARQKAGWDVGELVESADADRIRTSRLRRQTAIVIDDATKLPDLPARLHALLNLNQPVRVLLTSQIPVVLRLSRQRAIDTVLEETAWPPCRLRRLSAHALSKIAPDRTDGEVAKADGRPLMVVLGPDAARTITAQANDLTATATNMAAVRYLALTGLAAPLPLSAVARHLVDVPPLDQRQILHEGRDRRRLRNDVPPLSPDFLADAILARWWDDAADDERSTLIAGAIDENEAAVEARITSLAQSQRLGLDVDEMRRALDAALDYRNPDRRQRFVERADALVSASATATLASNGPDADLENILLRLVDLAESRPDDPKLQLFPAMGAVNAIDHYGKAGRFEEMETWGQRLRDVARSEIGRVSAEIQLHLAMGAVNAINRYGKAGRFEDLETWGQRLRDVAGSEIGRVSAEIQLHLAMGAVNAINRYGKAGRFEEMETWGQRLRDVARSEIGRVSAEIQLHLAMGAVNAINRYGKAGRFEEMETWGQRLRDVAGSEIGRVSAEIQLHLAKGAVNAIGRHGNAGRFEEMETWGQRLRDVAGSEIGRASAEFQLRLAMGAVNAINHYGKAGRFEDLETWGQRLRDVAGSEIGRVSAEIQLHLAKGAVNAIDCYGKAGRFEGLETWGQRLRDVAGSEIGRASVEIQLHLAKGAVNAIYCYGKAGRFEDLETWGQRLRDVAGSEIGRASAEFQIHLTKGAVNAINRYSEAGRFEELETWRSEVALALWRAPQHPQINYLAKQVLADLA